MADSNNTRKALALESALWVAAIAALTLAAMGHNFATGNHVIYLLWINRLRDPAYLARDWYLSTEMMHPNIVRPLRHVCDWLGDANGFFAALALSRLLLVGGVWRLVRALGSSRLAAGMAAFLAVWSPRVSLGGHFPSGSFFDPSQMAMAMAVVSLALLIERRHIWAGIWLGAVIHVHLFIGVHLSLIEALAVFFAVRQEGRSWRAMLAEIWRLAAPAALLGGYTLIIAAKDYLHAGTGGLSGRDVVEILAFRHPHHHSPLSWSAAESIQFILCVAIGLYLARRNERWRVPVFRALFAYGAMAIIVGTVFVEFVPVALVALFQFFRVTVLLMIWTCVEIGTYFARCVEGAVAERPDRMRKDLHRQSRTHSLILKARLLIILATILGFRSAPLLLVCIAVLFIMERRFPLQEVAPDKLAIPHLALPAVLALVGIALVGLGLSGRLNPLFARIGRPDFFRTSIKSPYADVRNLAAYLKAHTAPDDVILAPPGIEGLSLFSQRPMIVTFKEMTFTAPDLRAWFERITAISLLGRMVPALPRQEWADGSAVLPHLHAIRRLRQNPQLLLDAGYRLLSEADVRALSFYGPRWFITNSKRSYSFQKIGEVEGYRIFDLKKSADPRR